MYTTLNEVFAKHFVLNPYSGFTILKENCKTSKRK